MGKAQTCYYAYPIDRASQPDGNQLAIFEELRAFFDVVYSPGDGFTVRLDATMSPYVAHVNAVAAESASTVVAYLPDGVPTIGVPIEIDRAVANGQHVIIITNITSWMLQYPSDAVTTIRYVPGSQDPAVMLRHVLAQTDWTSVRDPLQDGHGAATGDTRQPLPVLVGPGGRLPSQAHAGDAGLDLYAAQQVSVPIGARASVPCKVSMELPEGVWGLLVGRSSALHKYGLLVSTGIIDTGYRGELYAFVQNLGDKHHVIQEGDRVAQLILLPNVTDLFDPTVVSVLSESKRGVAGFGSTGR